MRLRQVALVARELGPVVDDLRAVFGLGEPYNDPGVSVFGLENAVMPVGDSFLEVVSPAHTDTTAGRLLERRRGDGGYMVILQTDDLEHERAHMQALGVRIVRKSADEPLRWIAENGGENGYVITTKVRELGVGNGYNAATGEYGDLVAQGVLDPVKVTRSALVNATSIAGMLLTTETLVVDKPEEEDESGAAGHGHGHGH